MYKNRGRNYNTNAPKYILASQDSPKKLALLAQVA